VPLSVVLADVSGEIAREEAASYRLLPVHSVAGAGAVQDMAA
jgi:hypothetical protein